MLSGQRMKRSGMGNEAILLVIIVGALVVSLGFFIFVIADQQAVHADQSRVTYNQLATLEEVLNADCATEHRGIFLEDQITDAGNLDCIAVAQTTKIAFETDTSTYVYRFPRGGGSPEEIEDLSDQNTVQTYPILVRASGGAYEPGYLRYHVEALG